MSDLIICDLHPGIVYHYKLGVFYRLMLQENNNQQVLRTLPDGRKLVKGRLANITAEGFIIYVCVCSGKTIKLKAIRVAYEMFYNCKRPNGMVIYPKDLQNSNFKIANIGTVNAAVWQNIKDAVYNIRDGIKIKPHPTNAYTFVVKYRQYGRVMQKTVHDITQALQFKRNLIIKCSKIVTKYTVSN
jgi:hypothetical protein